MRREPKELIRDRIVNAAENLFWRYGIKKVTVDEIALAADVGKGTVYLHFDSKEEIGIAIIRNFKQQVLTEQFLVAQDQSLSPLAKLKEVLTLPIKTAHDKTCECPYVLELINTVRPQISLSINDLIEQEQQLIARILEDGNSSGQMHIDNIDRTAKSIKLLSLAYMPGSALCSSMSDPIDELNKMIDIIYHGLK
jgi:AcrR family transcriptional regulator